MYQLKDRHIDYILNDISARGVTIEDLQYNLMDHICCIIENNLEENGDFEAFYQKVVQSFFKKELKEIEDETISLVIFKHYYTMKKAMIISGTVSAVIFSSGLFFKFMHWPGAGIQLILGIGLLSFMFFPLMFILKIKEKQSVKDKAIIGIGTFSGILISLGILFKVMHWPGANIMMQGSVFVMLLLFLPLYFFTGIRNPETKVNTIVSTILFVSAFGLLFTLMRSPKGSQIRDKQLTLNFIRNEKFLQAELAALHHDTTHLAHKEQQEKAQQIIALCEQVKKTIVASATEGADIAQLEKGESVIGDHSFQDTYYNVQGLSSQSTELKNKINAFNAAYPQEIIDVKGMFFDDTDTHYISNINILMALEQLIQVERMVLFSQQHLVAGK